MSVQNLVFRQKLETDLDTAWAFFSDPKNLARICPPEMNFQIKSGLSESGTYSGQIIRYSLSPVMGIPMEWITEITHVVDKKLFVDEQRKGPYKMWHHQHHFEKVDGGVLMTDILHYEVPAGFLGNLLNQIFIRKKVLEIFKYREQVIPELLKQNNK